MEQVLCRKNTDETTVLIENRNRMDPFLQHDSDNFTDLCCRSCRDYSRGHDRGSVLVGSLSRIVRCDQFRHMPEEILIREHPYERAM